VDSNTRGEVVDEASKWLVGGGILTMSLAPFALPAIALLLIAALPLVALGLAGGLLFAVVIGPIVLARALVRRIRGWQRPAQPESVVCRGKSPKSTPGGLRTPAVRGQA
jgi:hypothetical protein